MRNATISADIIASTSLQKEEKEELNLKIEQLFSELDSLFNTKKRLFYGRMIKGDYVECYIEQPQKSLRIALLLKTAVKSLSLKKMKTDNDTRKRRKLFQTFGIRIGIGIGEMKIVNFNSGVLDGDAIYRSGRKIADQRTSNRDKIIIKNTLFFDSDVEDKNQLYTVIIDLLDSLLTEATARQCEILYLKLLGRSETDIATILKIGQSTVNQHSTAVGWNAIEQAVMYFEQSNL